MSSKKKFSRRDKEVKGLGGWMVGWLDGWMVKWLEGWMVKWLDGWMVGWLDRGLFISIFAGRIFSNCGCSEWKPRLQTAGPPSPG